MKPEASSPAGEFYQPQRLPWPESKPPYVRHFIPLQAMVGRRGAGIINRFVISHIARSFEVCLESASGEIARDLQTHLVFIGQSVNVWTAGSLSRGWNDGRRLDGALRCGSCAIMFGIHDFGLFLATGVLLNLTPGPDTLYILGRGLAQGRGAAVASALGISTGSVIHTFAAAFGLSAVLAASASAFTVVKMGGAIYLCYLGARMLFGRASANGLRTEFSSSGFRAVYRQGLITNLLNPKVTLFFLAFMPQFIAANSHAKFAAFVTLGLCFVTTGTLWCLCLAWFSSVLGARLRGGNKFTEGLQRGVGALFMLLGVRLAAAK